MVVLVLGYELFQSSFQHGFAELTPKCVSEMNQNQNFSQLFRKIPKSCHYSNWKMCREYVICTNNWEECFCRMSLTF